MNDERFEKLLYKCLWLFYESEPYSELSHKVGSLLFDCGFSDEVFDFIDEMENKLIIF